MHYMKKTKIKKKRMLAFKVDLEKAYDRVNSSFWRNTLFHVGFPPVVIYSIMCCVSSSSLSILWNGCHLDNFFLTRDLGQGDPMSPYFFILCMEKFALYIH